jgi:hypothetical protein
MISLWAFNGFYSSSCRTTVSPRKALEAWTINICRSGSWATHWMQEIPMPLALSFQSIHWVLEAQCRITSNNCWKARQVRNWQRHVWGMSVLLSHTIIHSHWRNEILMHAHSRPFGFWHHAVWIEDSVENFEYKLRQNWQVRVTFLDDSRPSGKTSPSPSEYIFMFVAVQSCHICNPG